mmetsp:Transcript_62670/g.123904  ORF Transcript_62670/g.123904 Transcript_62670/m.123904 type:complete len:406 (+) Transcript_62670:98-1315(+)|eukprot:CAMPEP_0172666308 /NCGR_PEP_ID=MMETSP1074-20121228/7720_1 /TAXON_ID=2916 /ORGANISM="Ceratium fusus, Strain PA161109" /LENGTH=405 /DNA_ID=CAMNT_0013482675 /DNA_START=56 /DNA_END=1273 /DNA_ORIENTATION=+
MEFDSLLAGSSSDSDHDMQPTSQNTQQHKGVIKMVFSGILLTAFLTAAYHCGVKTSTTLMLQHDVLLSNKNELVNSLEKEKGRAINWQLGASRLAPCDEVAIIKPQKMVRNNLGGQGPDNGEEGMEFQAKLYMKDADNGTIDGKNITIVIKATSLYHMSSDNKFNGYSGNLLAIGLHANTNLSFSVSVYDGETNESLVLPYFSTTFFDIDMSKDEKSGEYIIAQDLTHYYVANGSQVEVRNVNDASVWKGGATMFSATQIGNGSDNPEETEALTLLAKSRGVTLQYNDRSSANFTIGVEGGNSFRGFIFALRPSIICAKSLVDGELVDPMNTSVAGVNLPLLDGMEPVTGMHVPTGIHVPTFQVTENGTRKVTPIHSSTFQCDPMALLSVLLLMVVVRPFEGASQ